MLSKSMVRRLQESDAYPRSVCNECSLAHGGKELPCDGSTWMAICDICWEFTMVNNPVILGTPKFNLGPKELARLKDKA